VLVFLYLTALSVIIIDIVIRRVLMGILAWIVLGGIAGWIASIITGRNAEQGLLGNIAVGIVGGLVGGFLFSLIGGEGITGFNLWSLLVATAGATLLLLVVRSLRRP
jgi:uncharacterized membrane protein YeaQ/YmgE (transglycosylase-associated protein family)